MATNWQAMDWWRLQLLFLSADEISKQARVLRTDSSLSEGSQPHHQISLRSSFDIRHDLEFDLWLYYVDEMRLIISTLARAASVDAYFSVNAASAGGHARI
ncbi:MAG: hypothetical protein R3F36_04005 [Candidatus Competibacteraceae bacterium]